MRDIFPHILEMYEQHNHDLNAMPFARVPIAPCFNTNTNQQYHFLGTFPLSKLTSILHSESQIMERFVGLVLLDAGLEA
jgi:hypothetical protein